MGSEKKVQIFHVEYEPESIRILVAWTHQMTM